MIDFEYYTLENGLKVVLHQDKSIPVAVVNVLYNVGSKDEDENQTGFAHLFEHLMFGGSVNVQDYDKQLQIVGGDNNAFTSPDITNYYISLPSFNLETGLWLESDRMLRLGFSQKVLDVQKKVVVEEFKQRYLNQPYGDVWHKLRPLSYQKHPYQWPTIGKKTEHVENAELQDVVAFFDKFYTPNNAILVVGGNFEFGTAKKLIDKWFAGIPKGNVYHRNLPAEPVQQSRRFIEHEAAVSHSAIYKTYHVPGRAESGFYAADFLSDVLGRGKSSRLHEALVKRNPVFNKIGAYITGSVDPGLLVVSGTLNQTDSMEDALGMVDSLVADLVKNGPSEEELTKVKNQSLASLSFSAMEVLNRAMRLAYFTVLGDPGLINQESAKIAAVTSDELHQAAKDYLKEENASVLFYRAKKRA